MGAVAGKDILLFVYNENTSTWEDLICLTQVNFGRSRSQTSTETKCGTFVSAGSITYSPTAQGMIYVNPATGKKGHKDMIDLFTSGATRKWRIGKADPETGDIISEFEGTVTTLNDAFGTTDNGTFDLTLAPDPTTVDEYAYGVDEITLTPQTVASGNVAQSSTANVLYAAQIDAETDATITQVVVTLGGTWDASDLGNIKILLGDTLIAGDAVQLGSSQDASAMNAPHTFTFSGLSGAIADGDTKYLMITADIGASANVGHTVHAGVPTITFTTTGDVNDGLTDTAGTKTVA